MKDETPDEPVCEAASLELPSARGEAAGVVDRDHGRLVFFGGDAGTPVNCASQTSFSDETWAFDLACESFTKLTPSVAPGARGRHAVAQVGGGMYVHGGRTRQGTSGTYTVLDDLWRFDLDTDTWEEVATSGGPSARSNHSLVAVGEKLVLFGGNTSSDGAVFRPLGDLWVFDPAAKSWEQRTPSGPVPDARLFHAAVSDGQVMYVYGGGDEGAFLGPFFGDLWAYDLETNAWTELHDGAGAADARPKDRFWAGLTVDAAGEQLVLFGGHDSGKLGNNNQVWLFSLVDGTWSRAVQGDVVANSAAGFCDFPADFVDPDLSAPERRNAAVVDSDASGQVWIFGGKSDCGLVNDVWTYDPGSNAFSERSAATAGEICLRASAECATMCF